MVFLVLKISTRRNFVSPRGHEISSIYEKAASMSDVRMEYSLYFQSGLVRITMLLLVNLKRIVVDTAYSLNETLGVEMCVGWFFPLILGLSILC